MGFCQEARWGLTKDSIRLHLAETKNRIFSCTMMTGQPTRKETHWESLRNDVSLQLNHHRVGLFSVPTVFSVILRCMPSCVV